MPNHNHHRTITTALATASSSQSQGMETLELALVRLELEKVYAVLDRVCSMKEDVKNKRRAHLPYSRSDRFGASHEVVDASADASADDPPVHTRMGSLEGRDLSDLNKPILDLWEPIQNYIHHHLPASWQSSSSVKNRMSSSDPLSHSLQEAQMKEELLSIMRKRRAAKQEHYDQE